MKKIGIVWMLVFLGAHFPLYACDDAHAQALLSALSLHNRPAAEQVATTMCDALRPAYRAHIARLQKQYSLSGTSDREVIDAVLLHRGKSITPESRWEAFCMILSDALLCSQRSSQESSAVSRWTRRVVLLVFLALLLFCVRWSWPSVSCDTSEASRQKKDHEVDQVCEAFVARPPVAPPPIVKSEDVVISPPRASKNCVSWPSLASIGRWVVENRAFIRDAAQMASLVGVARSGAAGLLHEEGEEGVKGDAVSEDKKEGAFLADFARHLSLSTEPPRGFFEEMQDEKRE